MNALHEIKYSLIQNAPHLVGVIFDFLSDRERQKMCLICKTLRTSWQESLPRWLNIPEEEKKKYSIPEQQDMYLRSLLNPRIGVMTDLKETKCVDLRDNLVKCFLSSDNKLFIGAREGKIFILDLKKKKVLNVIDTRDHDIQNYLEDFILKEGGQLISYSHNYVSYQVKIWDPQSGALQNIGDNWENKHEAINTNGNKIVLKDVGAGMLWVFEAQDNYLPYRLKKCNIDSQKNKMYFCKYFWE